VILRYGIGSKRKEERIHYLKYYWASRLENVLRVKLHTSLSPKYSCAICGVSIDGTTTRQLDTALFDQYKIHIVGIIWENISCVRVTPHVYTTISDLDELVGVIKAIAAKA